MNRSEILEETYLSDEEEREKQEIIDLEEKAKKQGRCIEKIKDVLVSDDDPYARLDEIRFYIKELEND